MVVALWDRAKLAEDSAVTDGGGWGRVTLAYNTRSPEEVDMVIEEARAAGGTIGREPGETFWGGYSGSSSTPMAIPGKSGTTRVGRSKLTARSPCRTERGSLTRGGADIKRVAPRCSARRAPGGALSNRPSHQP